MHKASLLLLLLVAVLIPTPGEAQSKTATTERIAIVLEEPTIIAITARRFHDQLCGKEWEVTTTNGRSTTARPSWGWNSCGGTLQTINAPAVGHSPARTAHYYVGIQKFPWLNPKQLAAQLRSALQTDSSIVVLDGFFSTNSSVKSIRKKHPDITKPILVRTTVTELNQFPKSSSGTGISPFTALIGGFSSEEIGGFIRVEMALIDLSSGQVLKTLPVIGEFHETKYGFRLFQPNFGGSKTENSKKIVSEASREALGNAAKEINKYFATKS